MSRISYTEVDLREAVKLNKSYAGTLRTLGLSIYGSSYKTLKKYIDLYKIDTSHFTGQAHLRGKSHNWKKPIPLHKILVKNSTYLNSSHLKKRLLNKGLLEYKCNICGISEWCGSPLSLQIDHINGVFNDNRIENLRLLCPNCHSQTPTFCRGDNLPKKGGKKQLFKKNNSISKHCLNCNISISHKAIRCKSCAMKFQNRQKISWPTTEELVKTVENTSYSAVAKKLGVSDNAVRKRIRSFT